MNKFSSTPFPLVSVVTSVKNGERFLKSSIQSIIDQDYTNFEFIIVDDYSDDRTYEILKQLAEQDNRIKVYRNIGLPGLANALNYAIGLSNGIYILRHDADDISLSQRIGLQVDFMEKNPEIFISGSYINLIDEHDNYLKVHKEPITNEEIKLHLMIGTSFAHPTVIMRRSQVVDSNLLYQEVPAQDYELWSRIINADMVGQNLPIALVNYRVYQGSDSAKRAQRHQVMASLISKYQISIFTNFHDVRLLLQLDDYKRISHYLLTGNETASQRCDFLIAKHLINIWQVHSPSTNLANQIERARLLKATRSGYVLFPAMILKNIFRLFLYKDISFKLTQNEKDSLKRNIPIIIIVRDRLNCLKELLSRLQHDGYHNLILLNNNSTFRPLLDYLSQSQLKVLNLNDNLGHTALWKIKSLEKLIKSNWFVYTDPDVIPTLESKSEYIATFFESLLNLTNFKKSGFSLKIDDLPDHFHLKKTVIAWEKQFYSRKIKGNFYIADIDTTFALYRPNTPYCFGPALRSAELFSRHLPWYLDGSNLNEDELFYRNNASKAVTTWNVSGQSKSLKKARHFNQFISHTYRTLLSFSLTYKLARKAKAFLRKK